MVNLEVYNQRMYILKRPNYCLMGPYQESLDDVVVIGTISSAKITNFSVSQKLKRKDMVTMTVGCKNLFVLDSKNGRILGYN